MHEYMVFLEALNLHHWTAREFPQLISEVPKEQCFPEGMFVSELMSEHHCQVLLQVIENS